LIASRCAYLIWFILYLFYPLAYPISWILDRVIPEDKDSMSRNEIKALVQVHREIAQEEGVVEPFNEDEEDMVIGALSLSIIRANHEEIMKPVDSVFKLSLNDKLDRSTREQILAQGYSRIPICLPAAALGLGDSHDHQHHNHSHHLPSGEGQHDGVGSRKLSLTRLLAPPPSSSDGAPTKPARSFTAPTVLVGYILVKELIMLDVNENISVAAVKRYKVFFFFFFIASLVSFFKLSESNINITLQPYFVFIIPYCSYFKFNFNFNYYFLKSFFFGLTM
jgi:hypothetical protein